MTSTTTEQFYDDMWQRFGALDAKSPAAFHRRRLVCKLALEFAPRAGYVLDAGCGPGELLRQLNVALPGALLFGADVSSASRRLAQARCPSAQLLELDLEAPDFEQQMAEHFGRFDLIVCSEVIEHLSDDERAVTRLKQLLAPGGVLIVTVPGGKKSRFDELIGHRRHYTRATLGVLLARELAVERLWAWGFPFHNAYRTAVRLVSRAAFTQARGAEPRSGGLLGRVYSVCGRLLTPLYYANRPYWGEQLLAVARRG